MRIALALVLLVGACRPHHDDGPRPPPPSHSTFVLEGMASRTTVDSRAGTVVESPAGRVAVTGDGATAAVSDRDGTRTLAAAPSSTEGLPIALPAGLERAELSSTHVPTGAVTPDAWTLVVRGPLPVADAIVFFDKQLRDKGFRVTRTEWKAGPRTTTVLRGTRDSAEVTISIGVGDRLIPDENNVARQRADETSVMIGWRGHAPGS